MSGGFRTWTPVVLAMAAGLLSSTAGAQSYGPTDQILTVGVAGFLGVNGASDFISDDGYLRKPDQGTFSYYDAPLRLPDGALIENLCLFADDSDPASFEYIQTYLVAVKLVPSGNVGFKTMIPVTSVISTSDVGYGYYCTDPFQYTLHSTVDIDGDGTPDDVVYYLEAYIPHPSQNALGLGGVRITWKRQVSDPPATPSFQDVPTTDQAFQFIEALKASGITAGCDATHYCPDQPLTRRQMAVFLSKALGLHWVD